MKVETLKLINKYTAAFEAVNGAGSFYEFNRPELNKALKEAKDVIKQKYNSATFTTTAGDTVTLPIELFVANYMCSFKMKPFTVKRKSKNNPVAITVTQKEIDRVHAIITRAALNDFLELTDVAYRTKLILDLKAHHSWTKVAEVLNFLGMSDTQKADYIRANFSVPDNIKIPEQNIFASGWTIKASHNWGHSTYIVADLNWDTMTVTTNSGSSDD